jgi:hypothetical protein
MNWLLGKLLRAYKKHLEKLLRAYRKPLVKALKEVIKVYYLFKKK